ncbi:PorT family protein [Fibrella musci]|uniref:PorT family protein n=1 Tax=Fibrella musci TaxID=3242485 RepID=UPI003520533E
MNKVLLAVGILSASVAVGQTNSTTKSSSTTTSPSTSNYNSSNTNNYNSSNATSSGSSYSGTSGSMSTGTTGAGATGTTGTYNSNGTYNNSTAVTPSGSNNYNTMGTTTTTTNPSGSMSNGTTGTTGTYNSNGTYNNSTTVTPSGSSNYNTMGTSGATTTPSTSYDSNSMNSGTSSTSTYSTRTAPDPAGRNGYNNFVFGIYAGLNATSFKGESIDAENPSARLGYQAGFFVRGGGRLFGQIGGEYFASSSNYFRAGNGSSTQAVRDYINIQYIQIPVYIGYKLTDSERGNSAIRVQVGAEYANRISSNSNSFNLSKDEIKSGSFNALGQLGFDFGPFLIDLTYHYGLGDAVQINTFQGSSRRILSASVGFKF